MEIVSSATLKEKLANQLGLDQPSALDLVDRRAFVDEEAYLDAAVKAELERSSPEYQATRRRLAGELRERLEQEQREQEQREAQDRLYQEIRPNIQLYSTDIREIDENASAMARRDLAAGRISASELGAAIAKHAEALTEKRKDERAANAMMNAILRGERG